MLTTISVSYMLNVTRKTFQSCGYSLYSTTCIIFSSHSYCNINHIISPYQTHAIELRSSAKQRYLAQTLLCAKLLFISNVINLKVFNRT